MIDLHFHILPGLDDGPETIEESVELARAAAEAGTTLVAAIPHVRADHPFDLARIDTGVHELNRALETAGLPLEVVAGGEVAITELAELDRSELCGYERASTLAALHPVLLEEPSQRAQIRRRIGLTAEMAGDRGAAGVDRVSARGETLFERVMSLVLLGDLVSMYLAVLEEVDPTPVEALVLLKYRLRPTAP